MCSTVPAVSGRVLREVHHQLHAHRPLAPGVPLGHAQRLVELAADRAHRAVGHHRQRGVHVHPGQVAGLGPALPVHALVEQPHAADRLAVEQRLGRPACPARSARCRWPSPGADIHCMSWPIEKIRPSPLCRNGGRPGQLERVLVDAVEGAQGPVGGAEHHRAPARAHRIEEVEDLLVLDRRGHGDLRGVEVGEGRPGWRARASPPPTRRSPRRRPARSRAPAAACRARPRSRAAASRRRPAGATASSGSRRWPGPNPTQAMSTSRVWRGEWCRSRMSSFVRSPCPNPNPSSVPRAACPVSLAP